MQYIAAKLARPAPYSAAVTRRYPRLPAWCAVGVEASRGMAVMLRAAA